MVYINHLMIDMAHQGSRHLPHAVNEAFYIPKSHM